MDATSGTTGSYHSSEDGQLGPVGTVPSADVVKVVVAPANETDQRRPRKRARGLRADSRQPRGTIALPRPETVVHTAASDVVTRGATVAAVKAPSAAAVAAAASIPMRVRFTDVVGAAAAKRALAEAVLLPALLPRALLTGLRRAPSAVLLYGPPGTGVCASRVLDGIRRRRQH